MQNVNPKSKNFTQWLQKLKRMSYVKECFHLDENCSSRIILAHSIQNNKILKKISHNGEVLYFDYSEGDNGINFNLSRQGRKIATTFTGFCNHHDTKVFSPIENRDYTPGDKEQEFLFAYRALAKEYHTKKTSLEQIKSAAITHPGSRGIHLLESYTPGLVKGLEELENNKNFFNEVLDNKNFDVIETRTIIFYGEYHIAVSSLFSIEKDFKGNVINVMSNFNQELKPFYLTIFPQKNKTYILISYLKKNKKYLYPLLKQIEHNKSIKDKQILISNIIAVYVENFVISPITWAKMPEQEKSRFLDILFKETIFSDNDSLAKLENLNLFIK